MHVRISSIELNSMNWSGDDDLCDYHTVINIQLSGSNFLTPDYICSSLVTVGLSIVESRYKISVILYPEICLK